MFRRVAFFGVLVASTIALATAAEAANPVPGVDEAEALINGLTAPLQPILASDAPASAAAPAPVKAKHHGKRHKHHAHKH